MHLPHSAQILRPAKPRFIVLSLLLALCFQALPLGQVPWKPDLALLTLTFWALHQPQRVSIGVAFVLGVVMDVLSASLMGQHALAYVVLIFWVQTVQNRLLWYPTGSQQALLLLLPFVTASALQWLAGWLSSHILPSPLSLLAPVLQTVLWPLMRALLLAPQLSSLTEKERRPL